MCFFTRNYQRLRRDNLVGFYLAPIGSHKKPIKDFVALHRGRCAILTTQEACIIMSSTASPAKSPFDSKNIEMVILGSTEQKCDCCNRRTKHLKVLVNGFILFMCAELHGGKVERFDELGHLIVEWEVIPSSS